jgi:hypothetical protein
MVYMLQNYFYVSSFIIPWGESPYIWGLHLKYQFIGAIVLGKSTHENVLTLLSSSFLLSFVIGISISFIITCT